MDFIYVYICIYISVHLAGMFCFERFFSKKIYRDISFSVQSHIINSRVMQKYVRSYSGCISVMCRLFVPSNSNAFLNFKLNRKMGKSLRKLQEEKPRGFAYLPKPSV